MLASTRILAHRVRARNKRLGYGSYSTVYAHPRDPMRVVKVNTSPDSGLRYLLWAHEAGYGGREAPRLFYAHGYPDGTYIAIMERLEPVGISEYQEWKRTFMVSPFYDALIATFGRCGDLHEGNVMKRGDQIVLTDPMFDAYSSGSYQRHRLEGHYVSP